MKRCHYSGIFGFVAPENLNRQQRHRQLRRTWNIIRAADDIANTRLIPTAYSRDIPRFKQPDVLRPLPVYFTNLRDLLFKLPGQVVHRIPIADDTAV
ncbi:hypothetical protein D3C80_1918020 [compost metagenome]